MRSLQDIINNPPKFEETRIFTSTDPQDLNAPLVKEEDLQVISEFYNNNKELKNLGQDPFNYDKNEPWIQTYTGLRFTPFNPNIGMINIIDIAHALSMMCRFNGHVSRFYSVAQHSVLVSYLCNKENRLWGLLHDAPETWTPDLSSPLKRSGKFDNFKELEKNIMKVVCEFFDLPIKEPADVKEADILMLYTEERDLFNIHRSDWKKGNPVPLKIDPLPPQQAKDLFMKRFYELKGTPEAYEHYLQYEYK